MTRYRETFMCPFCRTEFPGRPIQLCSGPFTAPLHPSSVRPIFVEFGDDGKLLPEHEERLKEARETYG